MAKVLVQRLFHRYEVIKVRWRAGRQAGRQAGVIFSFLKQQQLALFRLLWHLSASSGGCALDAPNPDLRKIKAKLSTRADADAGDIVVHRFSPQIFDLG